MFVILVMQKRVKLLSNILLIIVLQSYNLHWITYAEDFVVESIENTDSVIGEIDNLHISDDVDSIEVQTWSTTWDTTDFSGVLLSWVDNIILAPVEPLSVVLPTQSIILDEQWKVDMKSLESAYVKWWDEWVTYCSLIARSNIENILRSWIWTELDSINQWDAAELIEKWIANGTINKINNNELSDILESNKNTLFDVYIQDKVDWESVSHRATLVLSVDWLWYILDPLRWSKTLAPQIFNDYIKYYEYKEDFSFFLWQWYNPLILEKTIIVPHDVMTSAWEVTLEVQAWEIKVEDKWWDSLFETVQDVVIEKLSDNTFSIWDTKSHLEFSKPAKIEISVPDMFEWAPIDITVQHEWDEWYSSRGITLNENALCDAWTSSEENNFTTVQDGKITFYTCGASIFNISPSAWTATITTLISWTVLNTQLPLIWWTGSVNGADVTLSLSGWAVLGTWVVSNWQWYIQPTSSLWIGSHTLCVWVNCITINIIPFTPKWGDTDVTFSWAFASAAVNAIGYQPDGNIVLGWAFTTFNWNTTSRIVRVTSTWAVDTNFTWISSNTIQTVLVLPDWKILIWWGFVTYNWVTRNRLVRVTSTWIIDTTFAWTFAWNNFVYPIISQPDGKIIVWWSFTTFNGWTVGRLVRVNTWWTTDSTFTWSFATNGTIFSLVQQPDGKVLVWWSFTTFNGVAANGLVRLTQTWLTDTSFVWSFLTSGAVNSIVLQPDWNIVVWWSFTWFNGISANWLVRLNSAWSIDTNFSWTFASGAVNSVLLQPDGKLLVWGTFNAFNWIVANRLVRLTTTWATDTHYTWLFANNAIATLWLQLDGKVLIWWSFTTFNGWSGSRLVRLWADNYSLIYSGSTGGMISWNNNQTVNFEDVWTSVTAVANTWYTFSWWSDGYTWATRTDTVISNMNFTAYFTINSYTLTYTWSTGWYVSGSTIQTWDYNTTWTIVTAIPDSEYTFSGWSDGYTWVSRTDLIVWDATIVALFTLNKYTLTYTGTVWWVISGNAIQSVDYNTTWTVVTAISNTWYTFSWWSDGYTWTTRSDFVTWNITLTAYFTINQYTIQYNTTTGGVVSGNTSQTQNYNTTWTVVTAVADTGYTFSWWSDGYTWETRQDMIISNTTLIAYFTINQYTLIYTTGSVGGSISWLLVQNVNYNNSGALVTAVADTGYVFSGWSDGYTWAARRDFMTGNKTITWYFTLAVYTITYTGTVGWILSWLLVQNLNYNITWTLVEAFVSSWYTFSWWNDWYTWTSRSDVATWNMLYTAVFVSNIVILTWQAAQWYWWGWWQLWTPIVTPNPNDKPTIIEVPQESNPTIESIQTVVQSSTAQISAWSINEVKINLNTALQSHDTCYNPQDSVNIILWENTKNKDQVVYQWLLRAYWLTKYSETDIYMPEKWLTREEAAKMFVNFARNVLCRTSQFTYNNPYIDIDKADPTLKPYIIMAYEYGIMKGWNWVFRPQDYISRDEFVASLMRTLLGKYLVENGELWYQSYVDVFKDNWYDTLLKFDTKSNAIDRYTISKLIYVLYYNPSYSRTDIWYTLNR